jgi:hypothetical protein
LNDSDIYILFEILIDYLISEDYVYNFASFLTEFA